MNPGLYDRFLGAGLGSLIAEAIAGVNPSAIRQESISFSLWQRLAQEGYGLLTSDTISGFNFSSLTGAELLRETMPLAVFFHDEPQRWSRLLNLPARSQVLLEAWGQIVAGILTDRWVCEGDRGLTQLQSLRPSPAWDLLWPVFKPLKQAITTGLSATDFTAQMTCDQQTYSVEIAIALGLFYLWNIPNNFRLAVLRSWHTTAELPLVGLTGALAGASLGVRGIPWAWMVQTELRSSQALFFETMESVWFHWLGCSEPKKRSPGSPVLAIASASTLQPRSQLRLVSQNPIR